MHTTRAVGTVTRAMRTCSTGDVRRRARALRHAPGRSTRRTGSDVVIVAGGIGLAPLRPGALPRARRTASTTARSSCSTARARPEDILYAKRAARSGAAASTWTSTSPSTAPAASWHGNVGVVTTLIPRAPFDPRSAVAMVCGPEVMMRFTVHGAAAARRARGPSIYVSMERNMKCAIGFCGHCQFGPHFVCKDGPVFRYDRIQPFFGMREI